MVLCYDNVLTGLCTLVVPVECIFFCNVRFSSVVLFEYSLQKVKHITFAVRLEVITLEMELLLLLWIDVIIKFSSRS